MSNPEEKESNKIISQIQDAIFHIHSMACIIEDISLEQDESLSNGTNNPPLSLAQIIKEKAEYCIMSIDTHGLAR